MFQFDEYTGILAASTTCSVPAPILPHHSSLRSAYIKTNHNPHIGATSYMYSDLSAVTCVVQSGNKFLAWGEQ